MSGLNAPDLLVKYGHLLLSTFIHDLSIDKWEWFPHYVTVDRQSTSGNQCVKRRSNRLAPHIKANR